MKLISLISCFLLSASLLMGQSSADELLKKVEDKGMAYKTIQAKLTYVIENSQENTNEKISGVIQVKGSKFKLEIDETVTYCDGATKWVYLSASNEVNITDVTDLSDLEPEEKFMNSPLSIYSLYKSDFKTNIFGQGDLNGKTYTVVDLTPKSLEKPYFKIRYWISNTNDVYAIKYFQKDGMRVSLFFEEFKTSLKFKDDNFTFNEADFDGVEVIDLR